MKYKWIVNRAIEGGAIEVRDNRGINKERDNSREGQIERGTQDVGIIELCVTEVRIMLGRIIGEELRP
jgi:hypothetical protein